VGCGVVYSQIIAELLDQVTGVVGGVGVDVHPEQFTRSDSGDLCVAAFEDEVVVYGFAFRVSGKGLVFDDDFDCVAVRGHLQVWLNSELY
jgi:hypothetical protein